MTDAHRVKVYVRDHAYGWLPASIVFIKEGQAFVRLELPNNWHSSTVLCQDSGLEEVEDALASGNQDQKTPKAFRSVPLEAYPNNQLPLQNKNGKSDMTALPHLHEAAMLYNLKERNASGKPYTRVRDVIVAMNPFRQIEKMYSPETQSSYANQIIWPQEKGSSVLFIPSSRIYVIHVLFHYLTQRMYYPKNVRGQTKAVSRIEEEKKDDAMYFATNGEDAVEPHIYEISCLAYRGLAVDNQDQTIVVTGESGSGKTETVKLLLQQLTALESVGSHEETASGIADNALLSSTLLEAFGNAKTRRNNNSSRFGKLVHLQYSFDDITQTDISHGENADSLSPCTLVGSTCTTYLMEKTRVSSHPVGERSFHIFYQLLAAPEDFKQQLFPFFARCQPADFSYLAQFGECDLDDCKNWKSTKSELDGFMIRGDLLISMMRALAIVLQLGNMTFEEDFTVDGERKTIITSEGAMSRLAEMLGIGIEALKKSFLSRSVETDAEELRAHLPPTAAAAQCDALANLIYTGMFGFLLRRVNEHTQARDEDAVCACIALVDIYGFERLAVNRFEQLCINYANEQLQQKYVADNFRLLKTEYEEEGIDIFDFSLVDNSDVLNLLDGRSGVFVALQEECTRSMGNDESFVRKLKNTNNSDARLIHNELQTKTEFGIKHFAGPVTYDATKFVERNIDKIPEELLSCVSKTSNSLLRKELQVVVEKRTPTSKSVNGPTLIEKFSTELRDLVIAIEGTQTRYIRCIIGNETFCPGVTNHLMTLRQLEYAGLMTSVALTRESLPDCLSYKTLLSRFGCLLRKSDRQNMREMALPDQIVYLLTNLFMPLLQGEDGSIASMPFACGRTKAYLRAGALDHLETMRYRFYVSTVVLIQTCFRKMQAKKSYSLLLRNIVLVQAFSRGYIIKQKQLRIHSAASHISSWCQTKRNEKPRLLMEPRQAAKMIQSRWRSSRTLMNYRRLRAAVVVLQKKIRLQGNLGKPLDAVNGLFEDAKSRLSTCRAALPRDRQDDYKVLTDIDLLLDHLSSAERAQLLSKVEDARTERSLSRDLTSSDKPLEGIGILRLAPEESKRDLDLLRQENATLVDTCKRWKARNEELSSTLETLRDSRTHITVAARTESIASGETTIEIASLKAQIERDEAISRDEIQRLQHLLKQKETFHLDEVAGFKEEASLDKQRQDEAEANELQIIHLRELEGLETKLFDCCAENTALEENLQRQERNYRAEKAELCNMLKEGEETYAEKIRALQGQVHSGQETEKKLRVELDEIERISTKLSTDYTKMGSERVALEKELKLESAKFREENEELRRTAKSSDDQNKRDTIQLQQKVDRSQEAQRELKYELSKLQAEHAEEQEKMMTELLDCQKNEAELAELADLKEAIRQREGIARSEEERLKEAMETADDKYREEIRQLREELFWAEESQKQLRSEISEMEASHTEEVEKVEADAEGGLQQIGEENSALKERLERQEQSSRDEKEELCKMLKEAEQAHQVDSNKLSDELLRAQESHRQIKSESSKTQADHAEELEKMMSKTLDYFNKDGEIASLKSTIEKQEEHIQEEKDRIRGNLKAHFEEVRGLKEEFVQTQESHRQHLYQVVDCLEAVHLQRAEEAASILDELDALKKESTIQVLTTDLELKPSPDKSGDFGLPTIEEDNEMTESELSNLRAHLAHKSSIRSKYAKEFAETLQKLQLAVKPENLKYIIDKVKKKRDSVVEAKVFGEIHRMSVALGELHQKEEHLWRSIDEAVLASLNTVPEISVSVPAASSRAIHEPSFLLGPDRVLQDLQQRVAAIEKQNAGLKKQLMTAAGKRRKQ